MYEVPLPERPDEELRGGILYRLLKLAAGGLGFVFRVLGSGDEVEGHDPSCGPSSDR